MATSTKIDQAIEYALWANSVQRLCLLESDGDVDAALSAAEHIVDTETPESFTPDEPEPLNALFAHDIKNRRAQIVLNRSVRANRSMSADAWKDLEAAVKKSKKDSGTAIVAFVDKYRRKLVEELTQTQMAALLEGASQVASKVPALDDEEAQLARTLGSIQPPDFYTGDGSHSEAISESARKLSLKGALGRTEYDILHNQVRSKAITIAGAEAEALLTKVRDTLASTNLKGADHETFRQEVLQTVDRGTFLSDPHMEQVLRANIQTSFSDGQVTILSDPRIRERFPYASYQVFDDDRTRHNHEALDSAGLSGTNTYRTDDPVFKTFRPPWDFGCRCSWTPLTIKQAADNGVTEAQQWLETGNPPDEPEYVSLPPFTPPADFERSLAAAPLSIRLSMQSVMMFKDATLNPGGYRPEPPGPPFQSTPESYPRDKSNRYLDKREVACAARDPNELNKLRESIPEDGRTKLDAVVSHLQTGGTLAKPNENAKVGVNLQGFIPDPVWDSYEWSVKHREGWVERDALRKERRKAATEAVRKMRKLDPDLGESKDLLSRAGATDAELRSLSRALARSKRSDADQYELLDAFEDVAEAVHTRIELEIKEDPEPSKPEQPSDSISAPFGMVGDEWHGPTPPGEGWIPSAPGPKGGKRWRRGTDGRQSVKGGDIGGGGRSDAGDPGRRSGQVGGQTRDTRDAAPSSIGASARQPTDPQANRDTQEKKKRPPNYRRVEQYADFFKRRNQPELAEWMTELVDYTKKVGADVAVKQLSEERRGEVPTEKVQYQGTGWFDDDNDTRFLKNYLEHVGITIQDNYETSFERGRRIVASAPTKTAKSSAGRSDLVARATNIQTKLEESKMLPGLESSEDIHKTMGYKVNQFTPDVLAKLDSTYGKGKWIIKSYGDEAYAGFGVLFPQRIKEIQRSSREALWDCNKQLRRYGYSLYRGENGDYEGITNNAGTTIRFGSPELFKVTNSTVKKLANVAAASAPQEKGTRLPLTPEDALRQDYGVTIIRGQDGKVSGVTDEDGRYISVTSKEWKHLGEWDTMGQALDRATEAINTNQKPDARFMAQPAFRAVGVSEMDRALGATWETSHEGRVHVVTRDGKASVVPYATMANRGDPFPVVFANDEIRAMEKAVQDAIDALPASERAGQTYAPDVMKTKDGWRVVELNASVETAQSLWLEENPFVIDAYVSHLSGRDPMHVNFIRDLVQGEASSAGITSRSAPSADAADGVHLQGKIKGGTFSTDEHGVEHKGKGPGGGQFVKQGSGGGGSDPTPPTPKKRTKSKLKLTPVQELAAQSAWDGDIENGVSHFDDLVKWLRKREGVSLKGVNEKYDKYNPESIKQIMEDYDWQSITEDDWDEWGPLDWRPSTKGEWNQFHRAARDEGVLPSTTKELPKATEEDVDDTSAEDLSDAKGDIEELAVPPSSPVPPKQEPPRPKEQPKPTAPPAPAAPTPPKEPPAPPTPPKEPAAPVKKVSTPNAPVIDRSYPGANTKSPPKVVSQEQHQAVVHRAIEKYNRAIKPSEAQVAQAKEDMKALGANGYRRRLMSNNTDRRRRRNLLLAEFGDGQRCPCLYCGLLIGHGTMEQDKIYTAGEGGRYTKDNLVPACGDCNKRRNNMPFEDAMKKVVRYAGPKQGEPGSEPESTQSGEPISIWKDPWGWLKSNS